MTVVIRDKPFPVSFESSGSGVPESYRFADWWDKVPIRTVPIQQIGPSNIGRSGMERFNTYYLASLLHQEALGKDALNIIAPLVNLEEIKRHGMRRMDVQSQCAPSEDALDFGAMAESQRTLARDWYCLNPYLLSGNLNLKIGRPDIKIGMRVRVPGAADDKSDDETYYVENVTHNYRYGAGIKTNLGVTRGWIGTDDSYRAALQTVVLDYNLPKLIRNT